MNYKGLIEDTSLINEGDSPWIIGENGDLGAPSSQYLGFRALILWNIMEGYHILG